MRYLFRTRLNKTARGGFSGGRFFGVLQRLQRNAAEGNEELLDLIERKFPERRHDEIHLLKVQRVVDRYLIRIHLLPFVWLR
ncbi:hypothetical protein UFOVP653_16 [uncultured Caudovirales phage]|uniref:Uncharacterized protein n=1 Tax=uncultured Caudovirales phage TaxID=2100421 RepID=A0A6J5N542_9CAUD|nr:hypothetical protein UFOVP653_16 [uncultured Caudovirales phage]